MGALCVCVNVTASCTGTDICVSHQHRHQQCLLCDFCMKRVCVHMPTRVSKMPNRVYNTCCYLDRGVFMYKYESDVQQSTEYVHMDKLLMTMTEKIKHMPAVTQK